ELARSGAALEGAHADELRQRFATALLTESDYYAVLQTAELDRVARERLRRAREQLGVARARVASGAAVSTDSLTLRLALTRRQRRVSRRVGQLPAARDADVQQALVGHEVLPERPVQADESHARHLVPDMEQRATRACALAGAREQRGCPRTAAGHGSRGAA